MGDTDVVVVGAGIVGLAAAYSIQQQLPGATVVVIDKEERVAAHQTGHNSGVIHSGIYYPPVRSRSAPHSMGWRPSGSAPRSCANASRTPTASEH